MKRSGSLRIMTEEVEVERIGDVSVLTGVYKVLNIYELVRYKTKVGTLRNEKGMID